MASHSAKHTSASLKKARKNYRKQITLNKRTVTCHKCKAHLRTEKAFIKHIKECSGSQKPESVICHLCGKGFPDRAGIEKHLQAHTKTPCCFCTMCKKTFAEFEDLESHISVCNVLRLRRKQVRKAFIRKHQIFKRLEQIEVLSENETSSEIIVSPSKTEDIVGHVQNKDSENVHGNNTINMKQLDKNNTVDMSNHQLDKNNHQLKGNMTISMDKTNTVSIKDHLYENIDTNGHQLDEMEKKPHDIEGTDLDFLCENCGLQFDGCLSLTEHYQVHSNQKLPNQYDHRNMVEFDDSLFLGNEELHKVSTLKSGPVSYVNDIMYYLDEGYDIPTVLRNTTSPGIGLLQGHSDQGHMEMGGPELITENLCPKEGANCFRPAYGKWQKAFEVSEVYALDCAYNEYGGWKFTKIKADGKPKAKTSDMAVTWNGDNGLTSICDPKTQDTITSDLSAFHQVIPSSSVCGQALTNPNIYCQTVSGSGCDTLTFDPKGYDQTFPDSKENVATIQQQEGYNQTIPSSKVYVAAMPDSIWYGSIFIDPAGYENNLSDSKEYGYTGYDNTVTGTNKIVDTNQDSNGNVSTSHKGYDMLDTTGDESRVKYINGIVETNQDSNGNVSTQHNNGYDMLDITGYDNLAKGINGIVETNQDSNGNVSTQHNNGYDMLDITGYDNLAKGINGIVETNQDSNGNVSTPHNKGYDMLDITGNDNLAKGTNGIVESNRDANGNVSVQHNKGYDMLDTSEYDNVVIGTNQTVDIPDSDGNVVTLPDNSEYVNHDAELLITWNSDPLSASSHGVVKGSVSSGSFDSDTIRFSNDALPFDMYINDFKPVQACTFENVFEKFVSDRNSNHCIDSDESTDTIFVCKYCREWFVTDPDLKNHLLQHCDTACFSSAGEKLADTSFNSTGMEHVHSHLGVTGKSVVDPGINILESLDTNVDTFQPSQFEEFWIHDSSTLDLTEQLEHPARENPTETEQIQPMDLHTHLNTVEQSIDGQSQLKGDQISYLDSLRNIQITCHQCSKAFPEDHLFCHHPCFTNENKDLDDCGICHRKFSSYESVLTHMRAHHELANTTNCAQYPKTYQSKHVVDLHCEVHTLEHIECHICGKLVNPAQLKYHVKLHNRDVGQQRSLQCVVCEQSLPDMTSLASHQYSEHSMHDDSITDIISCYRCPHCKEEMQHKPLFIAHVASHTGVFPFECSLCLEGFFYKTLLNMHSNKYHSVP
ncbi:uncharacterized protein [Haliotis asinina]|uniref:uncharacterized protein n=1 Tax=Haliotis asinina TaxID=109174 RepID=UPI003531AA8B